MSTTINVPCEFTPNSLCLNDLLASSEKALGWRSCEKDLEEIRQLVSQGNPTKLPDLPEDIFSQWLHCMELDDKMLMATPKFIREGGDEKRTESLNYLKCRKVAEHRQLFLETAIQFFKTFESTGMAMIAAAGKPIDSTLKQQTDAPLQRFREIIRHFEMALEHNQTLPGVYSSEPESSANSG